MSENAPTNEPLVNGQLDITGDIDHDLAQLAPLLTPILRKIVEVRVERETQGLQPEMLSNHDKAHVEGGWTRDR